MRYLSALLATLCAVPALAETVVIEVVDHKFVPETTKAKKGDTLEFHFKEGNHSVAMSELQSKTGPCVPAEEGGFFSGYIDAEEGESVCCKCVGPDEESMLTSVGRGIQGAGQ